MNEPNPLLIKLCYRLLLPGLMIAKFCDVEGVPPWLLLLWPYAAPVIVALTAGVIWSRIHKRH